MSEFDFIVFDAVGTTVAPTPEPPIVYQQVGRSFGSTKTVEGLRQAFKDAVSKHYAAEIANQPTDEDFERKRWRLIVADCLDDLTGETLDEAFEILWSHFAKSENWTVLPGVVSVLERLKNNGQPMAMASNFDARLEGVAEGLGITQFLDPILVSSQLGWSKPNPEFYRAAAKILGVADASRLLMIGDTYAGDVAAAKDAGWNARYLDRNGDVTLDELVSVRDG